MRMRRTTDREAEAMSRLSTEDRGRVIVRALLFAPFAIGWYAATTGCLVATVVRTWKRRHGPSVAVRDGVPWRAVAGLAVARLALEVVVRRNRRAVEELLRNAGTPSST